MGPCRHNYLPLEGFRTLIVSGRGMSRRKNCIDSRTLIFIDSRTLIFIDSRTLIFKLIP